MKLDESIELINKQNISEMEELKNIDISEMRNYMTEMMHDENMSSCLYEVLALEGFLPNELSEGEDHPSMCEMMMEDDEVLSEMYKSCAGNMSECGMTMQEWLNEKLYGGQKKLDRNHNGVIDAQDFAMLRGSQDEAEMDEYDKEVMGKMRDQYGKKRGTGVYYATANKQGRDPETFEKMEEDGDTMGNEDHHNGRYMFFAGLEQIKAQCEQLLSMDHNEIEQVLDGGHDWAQDHIATAKESIDQVFDFFSGESQDDNGMEPGGDDDKEMITGDEEEMMSEEMEDESINEDKLPAFKPVKGRNIDTDNKNNAKKDGNTEVKDAEKSQKTKEEKTEEKINVKFSPDMESDFQKGVEQKRLGAFNNLNLDFQNEVPQSYKDRVEMEVKTGHSRKRDEAKFGKEANVDHESTKRVGEAIWNASQANQGERDDFYKANPVTVTKTPYEQTSISGKPKGGKKTTGGGDLTNENVDKDIERMKKMFVYEDMQLNENKKTTLSEDEILYQSVSKKKFI